MTKELSTTKRNHAGRRGNRDDYLSLFPGASRNKPRFMALAAAVLGQAADLFPVIAGINAAFSPETAQEARLDAIGASLGLSRSDTADGAAASDAVFRDYLLKKLQRWSWDGTNESVPGVLAAAFPGSRRADNGAGTVTVVPGETLPAGAAELFPVTAGVRCVY